VKLLDLLNALSKSNNKDRTVLFKHINNRDVAFKINLISPNQHGCGFDVTWFNIVNPDSVFMLGGDLIQIKDGDLHKWGAVDVQAGRILRDNL
jgi:hypothetical protein